MKKIASALILLMLPAFILPAAADVPYETYTYSYQGEIQNSPHAFYPLDYVDLSNTAWGALKNPRDIVSRNGLTYIADTGNNRVLVFDADWNPVKELSAFDNPVREDGADGFNQPQGLFVAPDGTLYVADSMNGRVVCFDADFTFRQEVGLPDSNLIDDTIVYRPLSVAVDSSERLYVVSQNVNMGVMVMDTKGRFYGYIGAQKVSVNILDLLWRRFMTEAQLERVKSVVPTEYNNITIDGEGFLFVTTNTIDPYAQYNAAISKSRAPDYAPVKKLNSSGVDILPRNGFYPPAGDLKVEFGYGNQYGPSSMIEVALGDNGVFSLVDARKNKIFTYDADGRLLYIFGGTGSQIGVFQSLASIAYQGGRLLALDSGSGLVTIFERTKYGDLIDQAIAAYNDKRFAESSELWASLAAYNNNLDLAYIGLGDASYRNGDYGAAMEYYKKTVNTDGYSKAFKAARKDWMTRYFLLVLAAAALALVGAYLLFTRIARKNRAGDLKPGKPKLWEQLLYGFHVVLHPFNGYDEIKTRKRGGAASATIILGAAVLANVFKETASGYIFIGAKLSAFNLAVSILSLVLPVLLWCASSWCLTSLMDGKGTFGNIYVSTCYSLFPMILIYLPLTLISNFFTLDEAAFYAFFGGLALGWVLVLIFFGTLTIHDYSLGKNIVTVLFAIVGMMIIIFLGVLFFNLIQKIVAFIANLITEITYRF